MFDNKLSGSLKYFLTLISITLLFCYSANAQSTLTGRVLDKATGEVVAGATVYVPELKTGDITDKTGLYK